MRIEFEQIVQNTEDLASGLYSLRHLLLVLDNSLDQVSISDLAELIGVIAYATQKRADETGVVLQSVESN